MTFFHVGVFKPTWKSAIKAFSSCCSGCKNSFDRIKASFQYNGRSGLGFKLSSKIFPIKRKKAGNI